MLRNLKNMPYAQAKVMEDENTIALISYTTTVIEIGKKAKPSASDKKLSRLERERLIESLTAEMREAAKRLEFEQAAYIRDRIKELRNGK